jgi:hypothetical protein
MQLTGDEKFKVFAGNMHVLPPGRQAATHAVIVGYIDVCKARAAVKLGGPLGRDGACTQYTD